MDPGVVKAFQDLTYEDETPLSLGEHFKQMGNDRFKRGKKNAMYYRHAQQVTWGETGGGVEGGGY